MLKVGGEVDTLCTRCEMTLAHTIHAMMGNRPVKVECNTCHGVHRFHGDLPASARRGPGTAAAKAARPARERPVTIPFDEVLRSKNLAMAQPYSPKTTFAVDQVIEHKLFGLGWVSAVKDATKIEVTFRADVKILVHGKG